MDRHIAAHNEQRAEDNEPKRRPPIGIAHELSDKPRTYSFRKWLLEPDQANHSVANSQGDEYPCRYNCHDDSSLSLFLLFIIASFPL
jgi:hypothetical protein